MGFSYEKQFQKLFMLHILHILPLDLKELSVSVQPLHFPPNYEEAAFSLKFRGHGLCSFDT